MSGADSGRLAKAEHGRTCGPAGGGGIRTTITPRLNSVSCFVPRDLVPATFSFVDEED